MTSYGPVAASVQAGPHSRACRVKRSDTRASFPRGREGARSALSPYPAFRDDRIALRKASSGNGVYTMSTAPACNACARRCIVMGGDADARRRAVGRGQLLLALQAAHPRHPDVDDETGDVLQWPGVPQVLRRSAHHCPAPFQAEEPLEGPAHRRLIVAHGAQGMFGQTCLASLARSRPGSLA